MQEFRIDLNNGVILSSKLSEIEVLVIPDVHRRDMHNGYVWLTLPEIESNKQNVIFSICFHQGVIKSIKISICNPELYGKSWDDFSEAKEKSRAKEIESWLNKIGFKEGKYIWGDVWAGYDAKSASGHAIVSFAI